MTAMRRIFLLLPFVAMVGVCAVLYGVDDPAGARVDFARDIQPIFSKHCYECHGPRKQEGGLRWDRKSVPFAAVDSGRVPVVPGDVKASRLIEAVTDPNPKTRMPHDEEPLSEAQITLLKRWVEQGAVWPDGVDPKTDKPPHWSFVAPKRPALPGVKNDAWGSNAVDRFILARLEKEGLKPSEQADRHTLIRRVYLDLTGLPPSPAQVSAFVSDTRPDAYERLVDGLLNDPAYGERWANLWLDLARYADSSGYGSDQLRPNIWPYRDYVIASFNQNKPYDRFTLEQLAGDLLPNPTQEQLVATAFHRNTMTNVEGGTDDEEFRVAAVKDRVSTTMQVWMGLTMGCAQCHTHKYDPITQREYYQFYALFNQTEDFDQPDERPTMPVLASQDRVKIAAIEHQIAALKAKIEAQAAALGDEEKQWEAGLPVVEAQWKPLTPTRAEAASGATFKILPDESLITAGPAALTETYTLTYDTDLKGITAFRLEAMPDESLPAKGPGRAGNGNFVLNDFAVTVASRTAKPVAGRFVRIELPGSQRILSLAEVQVMRGAENIALKGAATQSSTAYEGAATRAIDNKTDGNYTANSTTHTSTEDNPWWEVDLGAASGEISRVAIWNRVGDNIHTRLAGFRLVVLDESRREVWQTTVAQPPNPSVNIPISGPVRVSLKNASASFSQQGFNVTDAISIKMDKGAGWAIAPQMGRASVAVFPTASPVGDESGSIITFTLTQLYPNHPIGRLRLSATATSNPPTAIPAHVADVLAVPRDKRTAPQAADVAAYYHSIAPSLKALNTQVASLTQQLEQAKKAGTPLLVLRELPTEKRRVSKVMIKGNFLDQGEVVQPAAPAAFGSLPADAPSRLGAARWLTDPANPLTARVMVNRLWAQLFGVGLVETEEDFGTQGSPPSHPELLDYLATELVRQSWDIKAVLRILVTSATYRQSSRVTPELQQRDSRNRLLARGPRFRLDAETVRDQAMALSGLLSRKVGGPSVYPPQPDGLWRVAFNGQRTWETSMNEDRFRRGLYTFWRRTAPYPSMLAFDATSREICSMRRIRTNTPLAAFVTLNDPVYVEASQALARRVLREGGDNAEQRVRYALELCTGRPAQEEQARQVFALLQSEIEHYRANPTEAASLAKPGAPGIGPAPQGIDDAELAAWTVVANVLLNLDSVLTKG